MVARRLALPCCLLLSLAACRKPAPPAEPVAAATEAASATPSVPDPAPLPVEPDLVVEIGQQLDTDPAAVLALADNGFAIDDICTSPFIEPEPGVAQAFEKDAKAALATVTDPALAARVRACEKGITLPLSLPPRRRWRALPAGFWLRRWNRLWGGGQCPPWESRLGDALAAASLRC